MNKLVILVKDALLGAVLFFAQLFISDTKLSAKEVAGINPRKILVPSIAGIGDYIMTVPLFPILKERYPDCAIHLMLVQQRNAVGLAEGNPYVDKVIQYDKTWNPVKLYSFFRGLRAEGYDLYLAAYPSGVVSALIGRLVGAKVRVGHSYRAGFYRKHMDFMYNLPIRLSPKHQTYLNLELLERIGLKVDFGDVRYCIPLRQENLQRARREVRKGRLLIGLHPGQKFFEGCASNYIRLAELLVEELDADLLVTGADFEWDFISAVVDGMSPGAKKRAKLVKSKDLNLIAALTSLCDIFVTNDSGAAHIANALMVPTFTLFGPTDPKLVQPIGKSSFAIVNDISCWPCYDIYKALECHNERPFACSSGVRPQAVVDRIKELLGSRKQQGP